MSNGDVNGELFVESSGQIEIRIELLSVFGEHENQFMILEFVHFSGVYEIRPKFAGRNVGKRIQFLSGIRIQPIDPVHAFSIRIERRHYPPIGEIELFEFGNVIRRIRSVLPDEDSRFGIRKIDAIGFFRTVERRLRLSFDGIQECQSETSRFRIPKIRYRFDIEYRG